MKQIIPLVIIAMLFLVGCAVEESSDQPVDEASRAEPAKSPPEPTAVDVQDKEVEVLTEDLDGIDALDEDLDLSELDSLEEDLNFKLE